jgi:cobalamin biosynthesis Mg chelatase CobN
MTREEAYTDKAKECGRNKENYEGMIELNDARMRAITRFIINIMRDCNYMYDVNIRGMEEGQDIDFIEVIAYLYEIIHQLYYKEPYRYMFHWANKCGAGVDEENIEILINDIMEEEANEIR